MLRLTDSQVKAAKPRTKQYRLYDGHGLRLRVTPAGGKQWHLKYRIDKREHTASLGSYPEVGLASARQRAADARALVAQGIHPLAHKKAAAAVKAAEAQNTFGAVTEAWMEARASSWAPYTLSQVRNSMRRYIISHPELGSRPIRQVTSKDIRLLLQSIAQRKVLRDGERKTAGSITIARNVRTWCRGVFEFAIEREQATDDPTYPLRNLTELRRPAGSIRHNKKLTPNELRVVLQRIRAFTGTRQTAIALQLLAVLFVRTGELRRARWDEFDLDQRQWRIPAARMKAKRPHLVPLPAQAIALLHEQRVISGHSPWVFPNQRRPEACMNATTINRALERMNLNGKGTLGLAAHGFRGTASTHLHELGFLTDVIEIQLAHSQRDVVKAAYNEAKYVPARTTMMQAWADYLDRVVDHSLTSQG